MLKVPFGMLFAERVDRTEQDVPNPEYDETEQISFITNASGVRVPFVSECWDMSGTVSVSSVRAEETDTDPTDDRSDLGTTTKVRAEEEYTLF